MSRRREKASEAAEDDWETLKARQVVGGGEEYHLSHQSLAEVAGLEYLDYVDRHDDGSEDVDEERLLRDAKATHVPEDDQLDLRVPLGFIEVRCNKCDHRVDVLSLVRPSLSAPAVFRSRYLSGFRILIGDYMPPGFTPQQLRYGCRRCGRSGLVTSVERAQEFFDAAEEAAPEGTRPKVVPRRIVRV